MLIKINDTIHLVTNRKTSMILISRFLQRGQNLGKLQEIDNHFRGVSWLSGQNI